MSAQSAQQVWSHVEIDSGFVTSITVIDNTGRRTIPYAAGRLTFFVDLIDARGARLSMWSGRNYQLAQYEAEACKRDFGVAEIADLTRGARA
ncbi:MAG TPA: hypothetical protein VGN93_13365 [Shinella sp.]|jgi:hypothetical protein|uniref:hypothetical protein n=1 Tax=Shinella sp. TaxID=1870904 RepID=UPI002E156BCC|nr:hypothetical protein [Shinella sp.]